MDLVNDPIPATTNAWVLNETSLPGSIQTNSSSIQTPSASIQTQQTIQTKYQKPRMRNSDITKERFEQAGSASLSVLVPTVTSSVSDVITQQGDSPPRGNPQEFPSGKMAGKSQPAPIPQIKVNNAEPDCNETEGTLIRVNSARNSKKLDTTGGIKETDLNMDPSVDFQKQLTDLVNDLTNKVLINQPENIYAYLADYLEDRVKTEKRKGKNAFILFYLANKFYILDINTDFVIYSLINTFLYFKMQDHVVCTLA